MEHEGTEAAAALMTEHAGRVNFQPFAAAFGIAGVDDAYAVQREYIRRQIQARGTGITGYKIGLTSKRMQEMCGIDTPIAGVVLQDGVHKSGASLRASGYGRVGLEFEIAVRLGRDLHPGGRDLAFAQVAEAVDAICPAIEIIDDRHADYRNLEVLSVIADNSWNAGIALGDFVPTWPELAFLEGVVSMDGTITDRGFGRDVLGHPFHPVAWLAAHLAKLGTPLRAGEIVMTGNLVTTKFPQPPCAYRFELIGLGAVEVTVQP
ncbi:MAG: 2-keto-4-pentenoate hydratase [Xanthobacteraceae bacterium]